MIKVGFGIRKRRKFLGITLKDLAQIVESDVGNLSRLERGKQAITDAFLSKIAEALDTTIVELYLAAAEGESGSFSSQIQKRIPVLTLAELRDFNPLDIHSRSYLISDPVLNLSNEAFAIDLDDVGVECNNKLYYQRFIVDMRVSPVGGDKVVVHQKQRGAYAVMEYVDKGLGDGEKPLFGLKPLDFYANHIYSVKDDVSIVGTIIESRNIKRTHIVSSK